jgi:hypothetical protein
MRIRSYLTDPLCSAAFIAGLAASFLYCRHLGAYYAENQPFTQMVRAPQAINPTTGCSPTVEQLIAMCKAHAAPDKIIVAVGGNSVFLGIRQPLEDIWSKHLQQQLGDGYAVVNLAQRGQSAAGGAESVAEALLKEGRKVIYVTNMSLPDVGPPDGRDPYTYVFWNAQARGLLFPFPERDRYLAEVDGGPFIHRGELKIRAQLDRLSNAEDLWNALSFTSFSTVWDVVPYNQFYRPRSESKDYEGPSPPVPQRFEGSLQNVEQVGGMVAACQHYMADTGISKNEIEAGFVPQMRPHSMVVVTALCPYYVRRAPTDVQKRYEGFLGRALEMLHQGGLNAMEVGSRFDDADFGDFLHFDPSGGRKLAEQLAPEVRRMAHELYGI